MSTQPVTVGIALPITASIHAEPWGGGSISASETRLEENGTTTRIQEDGATRVTEGT